MNSYPSYTKRDAPKPVGTTEFEILKASHKFLRDEDEKPSTWNEQLAGKYYSNLYREFAVCDLKHYKSGNFSLRWRTEDEVLSGSGETTCGNTRCEHHFSSRFQDERDPKVPLTTLELPFTYIEDQTTKSALVKVVLCGKCVKKLTWKRTKEKATAESSRDPEPSSNDLEPTGEREITARGSREGHKKKRAREQDETEKDHGRSSRRRSKSPHRTLSDGSRTKRHS